MPLFSQRQGIRPLEKSLQRESIDDDLKNRLWNALKLEVWDHWFHRNRNLDRRDPKAVAVEIIIQNCWMHHFKLPIDKMPKFDRGVPSGYEKIRQSFFEGEWWETYDLLEFIVKVTPDGPSVSICRPPGGEFGGKCQQLSAW